MTRPIKYAVARTWYRDGAIHRTHGPALEFRSGTKMWYRQGLCHRLSSPAVEWRGGRLSWYVYGRQYRERSIGIPDLIRPIRLGYQLDVINLCRVWLDEHTRLNRHDGPAMEYDNGDKSWYQHGVEISGRFGDGQQPVL